MLTYKDFVKEKPTWCPGCGDYGVLKAMQEAVASLGLEPKDVVLVSGIGCSGKITSYFNSYGFHSMHGRTLPVATGIRLANPELTVIAAGGDGDGYGIGLNHLIHSMRRNINITYIVMHNNVYGNTKGQTSPTSEKGYVSGSSPYGTVEEPIHPISLALASGATYVAQGITSNIKQLTRLVKEGIEHEGFSLINVFSPCVTYDKKRTYAWYKEHLTDLDTLEGYDPSNWSQAMNMVHEHGEMVVGLIYREEKPSFEAELPQRPMPGSTKEKALQAVLASEFK
jgi:2-oxoglutarate ferredoxin oxidoreductase subunit beta